MTPTRAAVLDRAAVLRSWRRSRRGRLRHATTLEWTAARYPQRFATAADIVDECFPELGTDELMRRAVDLEHLISLRARAGGPGTVREIAEASLAELARYGWS